MSVRTKNHSAEYGKKEGLWHSYVEIWSSTPYLGLKVDILYYTLVIANMLPRELLLVELLVILMQVKLCFCCDFKNKNMHKLNQQQPTILIKNIKE